MTDELLKALHATPGTVAHLVAELRNDQLDVGEEGEWTARQVMAHLRDDESVVMRMRLIRMLVEDDPLMPDFDEQAWMRSRYTERDKKETLLGDFTLQRQATLNILKQLQPSQWERTGRHEVSGPMTVRSWVQHWVEHDEEHVKQLERALGETLDQVLERRAQSMDPRSEEWAHIEEHL